MSAATTDTAAFDGDATAAVVSSTVRSGSSRAVGDPPPAASITDAVRLTALTAVGAMAAAALVATVVDLTLAGTVRGWLHYPFRGVPARPSVAAGIFAHNLRAVGGVLGLLIIARATAHSPSDPGRLRRRVVAVAELVMAGVVAANIIIVGAALGAYGHRMGAAMLPHGPVELVGYSLALALYGQERRRAVPVGHAVVIATASVVLLAVAAVLETFA